MKAFWFGLDIEEKLRYSRVAQMISNCKRREEEDMKRYIGRMDDIIT